MYCHMGLVLFFILIDVSSLKSKELSQTPIPTATYNNDYENIIIMKIKT